MSCCTSHQIVTPKYFKESPYYDGAELKYNPGLPDNRFDAYRLPSKHGSRLYYSKHHVANAAELNAQGKPNEND